jgi:hypothetical protein
VKRGVLGAQGLGSVRFQAANGIPLASRREFFRPVLNLPAPSPD